MNAIVIVDQNWGIGNEGEQMVYLSPDLKRFQSLTSEHSIVLGRKTLETFPGGRPLKNRRNLILSRQAGFAVEGAEVFGSVAALLENVPDDAFVVGGESVYRQLLPYCDRVYLTKVHAGYPADTFFPNLDQDALWWVEEESGPFAHEGIRYSYLTYRKT